MAQQPAQPHEVVITNQSVFEDLKTKAGDSSRQRAMLMLHDGHEATLHTMINTFKKGSYVAPHRHWIENESNEIIQKGESFVALEGEGKIILFDDEGNEVKTIILKASEKTMVWIPAGVWHTVLATTDYFIVYENKTGPWIDGADKQFHPKFPEEGSGEALGFIF